MRGFPPVQIFLLALAFALLAIPLSHLTGNVVVRPPVVEEPGGKEPAKEINTWVRLRWAHPPTRLSLMHDGQEMLTKPDLAAGTLEFKTRLQQGRKTEEWLVEAAWPEGTPDTALTLEVQPDGRDTRQDTRWSSAGTLSDVITLSW